MCSCGAVANPAIPTRRLAVPLRRRPSRRSRCSTSTDRADSQMHIRAPAWSRPTPSPRQQGSDRRRPVPEMHIDSRHVVQLHHRRSRRHRRRGLTQSQDSRGRNHHRHKPGTVEPTAPSIDAARRNLMPPRPLRNHPARNPGLGHGSPLLILRPPTTPFRPRNLFQLPSNRASVWTL
jgi:hypothetical protein